MDNGKLKRREFLLRSVQAGAGVGFLPDMSSAQSSVSRPNRESPARHILGAPSRAFDGVYEAPYSDQIAFPMGGMGAGMVCLNGSGALSSFSLRHRIELDRARRVFSALWIRDAQVPARVLEGPVPSWKLRPRFPGSDDDNCWGLPRFRKATFQARFPFGTVALEDEQVPLKTSITGWSPFSPGDPDNASLPVAALEYRFVNPLETPVTAVFSFNSENVLADSASDLDFTTEEDKEVGRIDSIQNGFVLYGAGAPNQHWNEGYFASWIDEPQVIVNCVWPCNSLDLLWRRFEAGQYRASNPLTGAASAGASIFVPFDIDAGESKTITVCFAWYVPRSNLFEPEKGILDGKEVFYRPPEDRYQPWYTARFSGIDAIATYWRNNYSSLRKSAQLFSRTFHDTTLPPEVVEAVAANLSILKSPTVLRQRDGKLWGWEGCYVDASEFDRTGISGTTSHVWNFGQSIAHLFPSLERGLRETQLGSNQDSQGLQYCRTPLPIRPVDPGHVYPDGAAADGQLGVIVALYRDWRISGDTAWLRRLWPRVRESLDFCIRTWDPRHLGWIEEPHVTTYDLELWGPDSLCASLYLGALSAVIAMGTVLEEPVSRYIELLERGVKQAETQLFNGEFFFQIVDWKSLRQPFSKDDYHSVQMYGKSPEGRDLMKREGPAGQCGTACSSAGLMGVWLSLASGLDCVFSLEKVESHLSAVYRYNFKTDLADHVNLFRTAFACADDSGLVLCSWPRGGRPAKPMLYSDEVWTGIEYQVASHLIMIGKVDAGLEIVRAARRRYDGRARNPFSEVEAGDWYARAMSSYTLLQALSGARFDAVDKTLHLRPIIKGDFRSFISTETGFGTVGVKDGHPFLEVVFGNIPYQKFKYHAA